MANTAQSKDRAAVQGGLNDLLGNVIRNDRQRSGRAEPSSASEPPPASVPAVETPDIPAPLNTTPTAAPVSATKRDTSFLESSTSSGTSPSDPEMSDAMTDTHSDIMTNVQMTDGGQQSSGQQSPKPERATRVARAEGTGTVPKASARPAQAPARRKAVVTPAKASASQGARLSERVEEAGELAATPTITVTLRIPQGFNGWLDGYVHGSWPEKIRKQELVVEGLMLAYARRGLAGEEVIGTALLGESEENEES